MSLGTVITMKFRYFYFPLLILIAIPIAFILKGYQWNIYQLVPEHYELWNSITNTATDLIALVTSAVLLLILLFFYRRNWRLCIAIAAYCTLAITGTQVIKSGLKNATEEARPFVYQISKRLAEIGDLDFIKNFERQYPQYAKKLTLADDTNKDDTPTSNDINVNNTNHLIDYYYDLPKDGRLAFIKYYSEADRVAINTPEKLEALQRLANESPYSFPSGHSIFAATWIMIFLALAFNGRIFALWGVALVVVAWGLAVEVSRILLGYHYSHDVLASNMIAAVFVYLTFWLIALFYRVTLKVFPTPQVATIEVTKEETTKQTTNNDLD